MQDRLSIFEREYFIQTRKEIDTEKQERNKILNYAILATGAISLAMARISDPIAFLTSSFALYLYYPLLLLITALVAARRIKLHQIADRWHTLQGILAAKNLPEDWKPLEEIVCHGLAGRRYLAEDLIVLFGLSGVVYFLIGAVIVKARMNPAIALPILVHLILSVVWFSRKVSRFNSGMQPSSGTPQSGADGSTGECVVRC